jgi:hypothetical protein
VLFLLKRPELALKACEAGLAVLSASPEEKDSSSERELTTLRDQVREWAQQNNTLTHH